MCLLFIPFHFYLMFYINFIDSPWKYNFWQKEMLPEFTLPRLFTYWLKLCPFFKCIWVKWWYTSTQICTGKEKCLAISWYWSFWPCNKKNKPWNLRVYHVGEPTKFYEKIIKFPCEMCPLYQWWTCYYIIQTLFFMLEKQF